MSEPADHLPDPSPRKLPVWRGFNLTELVNAAKRRPYLEDDFRWISEWGFNFVRLPLDYHCWCKNGNQDNIDGTVFAWLDEAVEWGRRYGLHVCLNFHRAPGYCVNKPREPQNLWTDPKPLRACAGYWALFARRYAGIPNRRLSFNLLNEPDEITGDVYAKVARSLVEAIRAEDPERLVIADGIWTGIRSPVPELIPLGIAQSTRGYHPMRVCFYKMASIPGAGRWPVPAWPLTVRTGGPEGGVFDRERLKRDAIEPWRELEGRGAGVHVGEWGCYNRTPHRVALAWMRDSLELWCEAGWGWALWNLRGKFGILDSERADVKYEDFRGHRLDRAMLDLLQAF